jgi:SAM-dependent methyltransferase
MASTSEMHLRSAAKATVNFLGLTAAVSNLRSQAKYYLKADVRARNARFKHSPAADGLPMPPSNLVYLVTGQFDCEAFYDNGILGAGCIRNFAKKNGLEFGAFGKVLDFGCGCGRVMRQWSKVAGPKFYGVDYNPKLIEWCQANLRFAEFAVNHSISPLKFVDETFDFIYSISVFTHLTESDQRFWMRELVRILKPGGHLIITVHGASRATQLSPEERQEFDAGKVVVTRSKYSGENLCATYHPEKYVREVLCRGLTFVDFESGGAKDANQDAFLFRKPN